MSPFVFVLICLASYRAAIALASDTVFAGLRLWVIRRWPHRTNEAGVQEASLPARLIHCARCLSVWTSLLACAFAYATRLAPSLATSILAIPAAAGAVTLAVRFVP